MPIELPPLPSPLSDARAEPSEGNALSVAKTIFDFALTSEASSRPHIVELLSSLSLSSLPKSASTNGRHKSGSANNPIPDLFHGTPLTSLFIDGMSEDLVWEQLALKVKTVCAVLDYVLEDGAESEDDFHSGSYSGLDDEPDLEDMSDGDSDESSGYEYGDDDDESEEDGKDDTEDPGLGESVTGLRESTSDEDEESSEEGNSLDAGSRKTASRNHPELDDGFFDLRSFNAEVEAAEAKSTSRGRGHLSAERDSDDSDDNDTPVDLFAPVDDTEHFDEEDLDDDAGEAYYKDFFDSLPSKSKARPLKPPSKSAKVRFNNEVRVKHIRAKGKNLPVSSMALLGGLRQLDDDFDIEDLYGFADDDIELSEDDQDSMESNHLQTMERLESDLLADDDSNKGKGNLSTHEKRMEVLSQQIADLEEENVRKKDWAMMGEASSRTRPQNSLLEVDLDFDRAMKAVPMVTEEAVQSLEERIKARILEDHFDDVVRKRPMDDKPFLPSRFFELKDTKSVQSLAQIYEEEFTAAQTGKVAGEDRDGKLKREHEEIEKFWENICGKLDALCNAHFVPKQPKATISVVSNMPTATLESALPTARSVSTLLAPEEVFAPEASDLRARNELVPSEKHILRNKQQKVKKKMRQVLEKSVVRYAKAPKGIGDVKKQKEETLKSMVKTGKGVTVVGKRPKDRITTGQK